MPDDMLTEIDGWLDAMARWPLGPKERSPVHLEIVLRNATSHVQRLRTRVAEVEREREDYRRAWNRSDEQLAAARDALRRKELEGKP
jgi:hypothetical protein